jgi:hypothetical protein
VKHEPIDGAVLGATVCVDDGVPEALMVMDMKKFQDPKFKFIAETIEEEELPIDAMKRGLEEELGIDVSKVAGIRFEEMGRVPLYPGSEKLQYQYCIKLPRAVIDERHEKTLFNKQEHHYLRKFPLFEVGALKSFLPPQKAVYQKLLKHLGMLEPAH